MPIDSLRPPQGSLSSDYLVLVPEIYWSKFMLFGRASKSFVFGLLTAVAVSTAVAPAQAAPTVSVKTGSLGSVYFASGSAKLNSAARITLWRWLPQVNAASTLNVVGYVQKSGSASNDRALSAARAKVVIAFFTNRGVQAGFTAKAGSVPASRGAAASARRAEVVITAVKPVVKPTPTTTATPTPTDTPSPTSSPTETSSPSPTSTPELFTYSTDGSGNVTVTGCTSTCPADLEIPATLGGNPVTAIGVNAFKAAGLTSVVFPSTLLSIGDWAFENNSLSAVTLPASLTTLSPGAFYINSLTSVTVPSSVTSIGDYVFAKNALTSVVFEGNAPSEGNNIFENDPDLLAVDVPFGATGWGATYSGVPVNVVGAPSPTPTPTDTPTPTPTPTDTPTPTPTPTPSAAFGSVAASVIATDLTACVSTKAQLSLMPVGGGSSITSTEVAGTVVGGSNCSFSLSLANVPVGNYLGTLSLNDSGANSQVGWLYATSLPSGATFDVNGLDTGAFFDIPVTVTDGATTTISQLNLLLAQSTG